MGGTQPADEIMDEASQSGFESKDRPPTVYLEADPDDVQPFAPPTPEIDWDEITARNEAVNALGKPEFHYGAEAEGAYAVVLNIRAIPNMVIPFPTSCHQMAKSLKEAEDLARVLAFEAKRCKWDKERPGVDPRMVVNSISIHGPFPIKFHSGGISSVDLVEMMKVIHNPAPLRREQVAFINLSMWKPHPTKGIYEDPPISSMQKMNDIIRPHGDFASRFPGGIVPDEVKTLLDRMGDDPSMFEGPSSLSIPIASKNPDTDPYPKRPEKGKATPKIYERMLKEWERQKDAWALRHKDDPALSVKNATKDDPRRPLGEEIMRTARAFAEKIWQYN